MREIFLQCFTLLISLVVALPTDTQGRSVTNIPDEITFLPVVTDIVNLDDTLKFDLDDCTMQWGP